MYRITDDGLQLTDGSGQVRVRLYDRVQPWSDEIVDFKVELLHEGLTANASVRTIGGDGAAEWFNEVAESFHGWSGTRTWQSIDRDLSIHARHDGRGHVTLTFALRGPIGYRADAWEATVDVVLDAGEDMRNFAHEMRTFVA